VIEARSKAWIKTAIEGDVDAFRTFATDDYVMFYLEPAASERPARWGTMSRDEWAASIRAGKVKYRSVELRKTQVHMNGEIATLSGEYTQTVVRDGAETTERGLFIETWVRRGNQWLAVSDVFP
jgi:ketosteroid isomerase-like protein